MNTLFGIPVEILLWVFGTMTIAIVALAAFSAVRHPVIFRLGLRNIPRRIGRSMLIVAGLMLATTIISAAFVTGDTIRATIRTEVLIALGNADEVISSQKEGDIEVTGESTDLAYFDEAHFDEVQAALADNPDVDGVMPVIWENAGVQNFESGQTEPRVIVFGADPDHMEGFGTIRTTGGDEVSIADLGPGEIYITPQAAEDLNADVGSELTLYGPAGPEPATVVAVIDYEGTGAVSTEPAIVMTLDDAQEVFQADGQIRHILISNRGGSVSGAGLTDEVIAAVQPTLDRLGIYIEPTKKDDLQEADEFGDTFSSFFVTFGSFSIAAGIMLIFLIFVMLAAERKPEMGISRAIGTERRHVIEMFAYEGLAYDVAAAAIGALFGVLVAWIMVEVLAAVIADFGIEMRRSINAASLVTAYVMGVVLTFIVVTISAWRVSLINIVTAIRNLPDPVKKGGRASLIWGIIFMAFGALLTYAGYTGEEATPLYLGISLVLFATIPIMRWAGVSDRVAFTVPGVLIVLFWVAPWDTFNFILPDELKADFNFWITGGLILVTGTTWVVMYNSDIPLNLAVRTVGRIRGAGPTVRSAIAYPLTSRFRTGMTLAMFTLVVFTLVVGMTTSGAFTNAFNDVELYSGGFDIRAETVRANPIEDLNAEIEENPDLDEDDFAVVSEQSLVAAEARQVGTDKDFAAYPVRGLGDDFLDETTYNLGSIANGYSSPEQVWTAIKETPGLAVLDRLPVPSRDNWDFGGEVPDFTVEGFYAEDGTFDAFEVEVRDPVTADSTTLTVIGILQDVVPMYMIGLSTSQTTVAEAFPQQSAPVAWFVRVSPGADVEQTADDLEASFIQNGMEATVIEEELNDVVALNRAFNYIIQGFIGLGLIVGVAALGVISARAVVERRHEIGVMRAIGFERERVQVSFLIESTMVAVAGVLLGTILGLIISFNVIRDTRSQPSWSNLGYDVPWLNLALIFVIVLGAALVTAWLPARQASRVYPAEALRYE